MSYYTKDNWENVNFQSGLYKLFYGLWQLANVQDKCEQNALMQQTLFWKILKHTLKLCLILCMCFAE